MDVDSEDRFKPNECGGLACEAAPHTCATAEWGSSEKKNRFRKKMNFQFQPIGCGELAREAAFHTCVTAERGSLEKESI